MRHTLRFIALGITALATIPISTAQASPQPLFTIGIQGGFTGVIMRASVHADGSVLIQRKGGGRALHETRTSVPLTRSAVTTAVQLAERQHVFTLPKTLQNATFGADVPVVSLTVYTARGVKEVHATGTGNSHVRGTEKFFSIWGIFYALAGYPSQVG